MPSVDCVLVYFKRKYKYDISKDEWNEYTSFISRDKYTCKNDFVFVRLRWGKCVLKK